MDEEGRSKRSIVCGVCRLAGGMAVNPGRLQRLVMKCKSSINGSLSRLGYEIMQADFKLSQDLVQQLPMLRDNPAELRQWSLRSLKTTPSTEEWAEISPPVAEAASELSTDRMMDCSRLITPMLCEENFFDSPFLDFPFL
jgi:hypothetical protein